MVMKMLYLSTKSWLQIMQNSKTEKSDLLFLSNRSLKKILVQGVNINSLLSMNDLGLKAPIQKEIVFGVLRYFFFLDSNLSRYLKQDIKNKDTDVKLLILMGIYEIKFMRTPAYAAINETVDVCHRLGKTWAKGLVNAVLRKAAASETKLENIEEDLPGWLSKKLDTNFPDHCQMIKKAFLIKPEMALRINRNKISPADYKDKLEKAAISFRPSPFEDAILLDEPKPSSGLPGWHDGEFSVQDLGAITLGHLFFAQINKGRDKEVKLLDACSAPGGKLFHLMELLAFHRINSSISALEISKQRIKTMCDLGKRLDHKVPVIQGDASASEWWDQKPFTHILVDAPCSSSGTIRRNPDIKLVLKEESLPLFQKKQLDILTNLWKKLCPGGLMFYSTCSLFDEENDLLIHKFVNEEKDAEILKFTAPENVGNVLLTDYGCNLLPFDKMSDGFYCSLISKKAI